MLSIDLDPAHQERLDKLAESQGQNADALARRIVLDYLDFQTLPTDSDDAWAEASVALTPEFVERESWGENGHGS